MLLFNIKINQSAIALCNIWLSRESSVLRFFEKRGELLAIRWETSLIK